MSLSILRQELKTNKLRCIYLFYGPETYLLNFYVEDIKSRILDPATKQVNYSLFEGRADIAGIVSACTTMPMLSDKKLVVLKNTGLFKAAKTASGSSLSEPTDGDPYELQESETSDPEGGSTDMSADESSETKSQSSSRPADVLNELFKEFPDFTCLIIIEESVDKRLSIYKSLTKYGLVVEFQLQPIRDLEVWVMNLAGKEGKVFDRGARAVFMQKCEPSMIDIKNEIDKLILYTGSKKSIEISDIESVCSFSVKTKIFDLIDSLVNGNRMEAIRELNELIVLKEPVQKIFIMISRHFIQLRQIKHLADSGMNLNETTTRMALNPYVAQKMWRQRLKFQNDKLDDIIRKCYYQDIAVKSGELDSDSALEALIASI